MDELWTKKLETPRSSRIVLPKLPKMNATHKRKKSLVFTQNKTKLQQRKLSKIVVKDYGVRVAHNSIVFCAIY